MIRAEQLWHIQRKAIAAYQQLSLRERRIVSIAGLVVGVYLSMTLYGAFQDFLVDRELTIARRKADLQNVSQLLGKYRQREMQLKERRETFEKSQLTFEQVTSELDKIVRESIGSDNYDLKRSETGSQIGIDFEKQDFSLRVRSLNLSQLVTLLYKLEEGKTPLFLGKVDLIRSPRPDDFSATLEVFSIRRRAA